MNSLSSLFAAGPFLAVVLILIAAVILVYVLYLKNLQDLLKEVSDVNRDVPAANVWLMFIPFFSIIYSFILYPKIASSLTREFESRGIPQEGDYGKGLGLAMAIIGVVGLVPRLSDFTGIPSLVIIIIYWVKMAKYKDLLRSSNKSGFTMSNNPDLLD
jgi:magnesium-transporting ATPase (P-type)